jgi:hypothetical protein
MFVVFGVAVVAAVVAAVVDVLFMMTMTMMLA